MRAPIVWRWQLPCHLQRRMLTDDNPRGEEGETIIRDILGGMKAPGAAVVERRGGMLIHGAIIAREYGIPCVTGAPRAVVVRGAGWSARGGRAAHAVATP